MDKAVADSDLKIRGLGGWGGGAIQKGEARSHKKFFFGLSGLSLV